MGEGLCRPLYFRPMPYDFHSDSEHYLEFLSQNARKSIMPFIADSAGLSSYQGLRILELGCGEGGNLRPFLEDGAHCVGIDLNKTKIEKGKEIMSEFRESGKLDLRFADLFAADVQAEFKGKFDLIILKDVIEHIPDKEEALEHMKNCLVSGGHIFIGWPPWFMPFGGHQQICHSRFLGRLPWIHLLPKQVYIALLKLFQEPREVVDELAEIVDYRVSIDQMHRLMQKTKLKFAGRKYYFINPIYEYKFGLKAREQMGLISAIPYLRDFLTTSAYYLLKANKD